MNKVLYQNVNLLDGTYNFTLQEGVDILVEDNTIKEIGKNINTQDAQVIDMNGAYCVPGLINLHVHIPAGGKLSKTKVANKTKLVSFIKANKLNKQIGLKICHKYVKEDLLSGTTTIRAVGGISDFDTTLRDKINRGKLIGPRIIACNEAIGTVGGHMDKTVTEGFENLNDALKKIDTLKAQNVDWIKIMITGGVLDAKEIGHPGELKMEESWIKALCDKAHKLGLKVCAHVEGPEGFHLAIKCGVDTIEHGSLTNLEDLKIFKDRDGALICTLSPAVPLSKLSKEVTGYDDNCTINSTVLLNNMISCVNMAKEAGVTIGLGTDTGCPFVTHYNMYKELVYFKDLIEGVTPNFAIYSATLNNAKIIGLDKKIGSVEKNKLADFFFVKNNPLDDLNNLKDPILVVKDGKRYTKKVKKYQNIEEALDSIKL